MLLASMAEDRSTFDALASGFEKRKNGRGMMSWKFAVCGGVTSGGAATDADLDIAMALIKADRQWGGYRTRAEMLVSALKQFGTASCNGLTVLRPGDNWGACQDAYDKRINPSYFAPGYFREFAAYVPNQADFWLGLTNDAYTLLAKFQQANSGLFPNWGYVDGTSLDGYGYDACRVPWRIATDYAWSGNASAKALLVAMHDAVVQRGGLRAAASEHNSCFLGGFALTAGAVSQSETDQWTADWINAIPQGPDGSMGDNPYFQGTLRVLDLALASGQL
jgi:endo-1,4-beta-D-glucanase Y